MKCNFVSYHLIVFDAIQIVEPFPNEVEPSPDEIKSYHWSPLLTCNHAIIAAQLRGIMKVKKFLIVVINFMHILEHYHLVRLIVMYFFMRHCSFQICSHFYQTSFDAGLSLTVFLGTAEIRVHVVHTSCKIIAYTLESLSSLWPFMIYTEMPKFPDSSPALRKMILTDFPLTQTNPAHSQLNQTSRFYL